MIILRLFILVSQIGFEYSVVLVVHLVATTTFRQLVLVSRFFQKVKKREKKQNAVNRKTIH